MNELEANRLLAWVYVYGGGNEALTHDISLIEKVREAKKYFDLLVWGNALDELCFNYSIFLPYENMPDWCKELSYPNQDKKQKETGSFYTPPIVVYWICEMTCDSYFGRHNRNTENFDFDDFTILEPSCGSGAFCVGMLQYLYDKFGSKALEYTYPMYGNDINPYAVEITKLRVWLFYSMRTTAFEEIHFGENFLQEILDNQFLVKNTLLEKDTQVSDGLFGNPIPIKKYDLIVGNPPYIQIQKLKDQQKDFESQNFKVYNRTGDIYCLFYEKGIRLLKPNGILAYITSNKWLRAGYGEVLRNYFCDYNPLELVDFGGVQIFNNATVDTNILLVENAPFNNEMQGINMTKDIWECAKKTFKEMQEYKMNIMERMFGHVKTTWGQH